MGHILVLVGTPCGAFCAANVLAVWSRGGGDDNEILNQLREAVKQSKPAIRDPFVKSSDNQGQDQDQTQEQEDEMFSDLPGSMSEVDARWRLKTPKGDNYIGSSVSDHDNWVRDRSGSSPEVAIEQKLFGALGHQPHSLLRVPMGEQQPNRKVIPAFPHHLDEVWGTPIVLAEREVARPKQIILVRHGESQGNSDGAVYTRVSDWRIPLTPAGRMQARFPPPPPTRTPCLYTPGLHAWSTRLVYTPRCPTLFVALHAFLPYACVPLRARVRSCACVCVCVCVRVRACVYVYVCA